MIYFVAVFNNGNLNQVSSYVYSLQAAIDQLKFYKQHRPNDNFRICTIVDV